MKKADKEKIIKHIEEIKKGYSYCFTYSEINKPYIKRFANNRFESSLFRNELTVLHLDILESKGITDTYEGIPKEYADVEEELRKFYVKEFEKAIIEQLAIRKEEENERKKKEKQAEEESKGNTVSRKTKNSKKK